MSKFDEKCSKCRNYNGNILICESCAHYKPKTTVFDRITTSPEVLAEKFVYFDNSICDGNGVGYSWCSAILPGNHYDTEEKAVVATLHELNQPIKK